MTKVLTLSSFLKNKDTTSSLDTLSSILAYKIKTKKNCLYS